MPRVILPLSAAAAIVLATALPALASDSRCPALQPGQQALAIGTVTEKLTAQGYKDIRKIEREGGCYEVKAVDKDGKAVKLYLNALTGEPAQVARKS